MGMKSLNETVNRILQISGVINEVVKTPHFIQRMGDRLSSHNSTFTTEKEEIRSLVMGHIETLSRISFPGQDNIGVMIFRGPRPYVYHAEVDGKTEHSEGNFIWVVIRANDMETVVFGDSSYKPRNTQLHFTLSRMVDFISQVKHGDSRLTERDLVHLKTWNPQQAVQQKPSTPAPIMVVIDGVKWLVDVASQMLVQKNNPNKKMNINDALGIVDEPTGDMILSAF